ncbi:uncharacterized protein LOC107042543 [Diachasma alloeum]|uniref:uncharacterized protein LOC107042543 n=1 Tax=Diachasma alloeum TaxID=454923 RepID=UPI0007384ABB|nr:uncharacterized protein LOC107042543 [Diachasma alloeum]
MAAVVYLKMTSSDGVSVPLATAKTKAPLKQLTIPRLELNPAVMLAKLTRYVRVQFNLDNAPAEAGERIKCPVFLCPVFLWADSAVTLAWISSHPSRWKEYVHNRVASIQELVPGAKWRYISGKEHPVACASRGITVAQLSAHKLWWMGPKWLQLDSSQWPKENAKLDPSANLEEKPASIFTVSMGSTLWDFIIKYSSLYKLLRITAARLYWVRAAQAHYLQSECSIIYHGQQLGRSHPLTKLTAFMDHQGVLRVGGRLKFSNLHPESKQQAIVPKDSELAELLSRDSHQRTLHSGTQLTLTHLRRFYWIIGERAPVRSFILKCVECARQRRVRAQQLMGQLPPARLSPGRAFSNTDVDYAGPVSIKTWKGCCYKTQKGWLVIFVCMATSALHLEAATDYSADGFIAAYRRFVSRRGRCRNLFSDCGTNFVGADKELKRLFSAGSKEFQHLTAVCLQDGTRWSFNPPGAPHFGGKREAAVKSVKYHLSQMIRDTTLTFEELSTCCVSLFGIF